MTIKRINSKVATIIKDIPEPYKLMGYDAVVLGERDFDEGEKALLGFEKDYKIHWISANAIMVYP